MGNTFGPNGCASGSSLEVSPSFCWVYGERKYVRRFHSTPLDLPVAGSLTIGAEPVPQHKHSGGKSEMNKFARYAAILVGIIVIAAGGFVLFGTPANQTADTGAAMVVVKMPSLSSKATTGQERFAGNCALCHGVNADGREGKGPPLIHKIYEPNHHGDASFYSAALNGVRAHHWRFGNMPPVAGIKPEEVEYIITYVREVQRHTGIQ